MDQLVAENVPFCDDRNSPNSGPYAPTLPLHLRRDVIKRRFLNRFGVLCVLIAQQVSAYAGVGWSISAAGSGWYLERISKDGDRVQLTCSPVNRTRWTYGMIIPQAGRSARGAHSGYTLIIRQEPNTWSYPLIQTDVGYQWHALGQRSFDALLRHLSEATLADRILVPELGISFSPSNSDQETTFEEYRKLCSVPRSRVRGAG